MSDVLKNSVHDTTTTSGLGALVMLGVAPTGRRTVAAALTNGQTATFRIEDASGNWETRSGITWTSASSTLSRGTLKDSSTGSAIDFAAGTKQVTLVQDASQVLTSEGFTMTGAINWADAVTVTASTTPDIGAAASNFVILSGAVTVAGFASIAAGAVRKVKHTGGHVLTHHATQFILRGKASITTETDDVSEFRSLGSGNWEQLLFQRASDLPSRPTAVTAEIAAAIAANPAPGALIFLSNNFGGL